MAGAGAIFLLSLFLVDYEPIVFSFKEYSGDILRFKPLLLIACLFVLGTHFGVEQTSFSLLLKEQFGLLPRQIGLVFACMGLWMALAVPLVGRFHDKRRSVFLFFLGGMAFSALFQVLTPLAVGIRSLVVIRLLHNLGDTVALLELGVLVALLFPSGRLGGNSGLLYGVRTLATFLAAVVSGSLNREWGYGASFMGSGLFVLCFVAGSFAFIGFSATRRQAVGWQESGK
jgi:MFS family permease